MDHITYLSYTHPSLAPLLPRAGALRCPFRGSSSIARLRCQGCRWSPMRSSVTSHGSSRSPF
eukprot:3594170-Lingulodinium_polyedra.AAC.1